MRSESESIIRMDHSVKVSADHAHSETLFQEQIHHRLKAAESCLCVCVGDISV